MNAFEIRKSCSHRVEINIDSPYKWGKAWTGTEEEHQKLNEHFLLLLCYFGHLFFDDGHAVVQGKSIDDLPELSYMHPMQPVIYCNSRERADEIVKIFKENPLDLYSIQSISIEDIKTKEREYLK